MPRNSPNTYFFNIPTPFLGINLKREAYKITQKMGELCKVSSTDNTCLDSIATAWLQNDSRE